MRADSPGPMGAICLGPPKRDPMPAASRTSVGAATAGEVNPTRPSGRRRFEWRPAPGDVKIITSPGPMEAEATHERAEAAQGQLGDVDRAQDPGEHGAGGVRQPARPWGADPRSRPSLRRAVVVAQEGPGRGPVDRAAGLHAAPGA